jgi:hypothetical protein
MYSAYRAAPVKQAEKQEAISGSLAGGNLPEKHKAKGKRKKEKGKRKTGVLPFSFFLFPFAFCLVLGPLSAGFA